MFSIKKQCLNFLSIFFISLALILAGCSGSSTGSIGSSDASVVDANPNLLAISPLTKTVALGATLNFEVSGGSEPYTFEVYYGNGTITSAGAIGTYHAPLAQGAVVIRVQDSSENTGYATVEITDAPVIEPVIKTLAVGNKFPFAVLSGKSPYAFSMASGEGTVNATTGEFTAGSNAGSAVVRVTDADNRTADASVTINGALSFAEKNIYVAKSANYTLAATGGVAPYRYIIAAGAGSVDKTTGIFTASNNVGSTSVHVFDSLGNVDLAVVNITTDLSISPGTALIAKNGSLSFSATGGVPPYSYTVQAGGLGSISALTVNIPPRLRRELPLCA
jgi:hypothetical protein